MSQVLQVSSGGVELVPVPNNARKKWRVAYRTLCFTRVLLSLATREIAAEDDEDKLSETLLQAPPHSVVDVETEDFPISQTLLRELVRKKDLELLHQLGGVKEVALALRTDVARGIHGCSEDLDNRRQAFGSNNFQRPLPRTWKIMMESLKDPIIITLLVYATLSLGFGIRNHGPRGWSDGGSIFVAVFLVIIVTTLSNIWPQRQFYKQSKCLDDISVEVIRDGQKQKISIFDAVVGDVVLLRVGNQVPADGLYIDGSPLKVDESIVTKEKEPVEVNDFRNPFLLSGTVIVEGSAQMVITAVGMNAELGEMTSQQRHYSTERIPLHVKLRNLTLQIAFVGLVAASLVLLVLLIRYFIGNMYADDGFSEFIPGQTRIREVCKTIIGILATPVAIASTAIPEGLLLAVTITIGYSTKRMAAEFALVRNLSACEVTGAVTVICTNKSGTLTLNCLQVSLCSLGLEVIRKEDLASSSIASKVLELLCGAIGWKTAEILSENVSAFSDDQTTAVIHDWCEQEMHLDVKQIRDNYTVLRDETSALRTADGSIVIQKKTDKSVHVHKKGTPRMVLALCSQFYERDGTISSINANTQERLEQIIQEMETKCIKCLAFAHKEISGPNDVEDDSNLQAKLEEGHMNLIGFVGLKNSLTDCQLAGVDVKMVTKDDLPTAIAAAIECGIIIPNPEMTTDVVKGEDFRNYEENERLEKVGKIRVVARANTFDKRLVVQSLKQKGRVVAVIGDSPDDALALREADVGLALGHGADIAKENADIIIFADNFASVTRLLRWGRGMYNNIQIFTQFQLTASVASLVIDFVTAISASKPPTINIVTAISAGEVPYAALQVLWVKLIVGTFAALALTIEKPTEELMQHPPADRNGPFITNVMWRNIVIQALYQIIILLTLQFQGETIFHLNSREKDTMIFNIFVLCQIFIIFNTRKFEKNIFKGLQRNKLFWVIIGAIILLQVMIVELLKEFANTEQLNWQQWAVCVSVGVLVWPLGLLLKSIPVPEKPFFSHSSRRT